MATVITTDNFDQEVVHSDLPVMLDFQAPWCMYCRRLAPVIAKLEKTILWDSEMVDVIFLLVVKMTNDFEIRRTQAFYKQYIKLVGTDEQVNVLRNFQTNVDFYKYLIK